MSLKPPFSKAAANVEVFTCFYQAAGKIFFTFFLPIQKPVKTMRNQPLKKLLLPPGCAIHLLRNRGHGIKKAPVQ
ncbi:MAG: hypothetical protein CMN32_05180 [Saprospirales bacterium]|nr:hypothetical protein [Saprospirales bacterium]